MTKRMVFADDFSQHADVAWLWVNSHRWPDWHIDIVTADKSEPGRTDLETWEPDHPRVLLAAASDGTTLQFQRSRGEPRETFDQLDHDLLVVGPRGGGLRKWLHLGSTSESLTNDPPLPLVVAKHGTPTRRVLVTNDGSPHCMRALEAFRAMPWIGQTKVMVLTVPRGDIDPESLLEQAAEYLGDAPASVDTRVLEPDPMKVFYQPRDMIAEMTELWKADLLVMGSRGVGGLGAIRAGSITGWLAGHVPCSVLLARCPLEAADDDGE